MKGLHADAMRRRVRDERLVGATHALVDEKHLRILDIYENRNVTPTGTNIKLRKFSSRRLRRFLTQIFAELNERKEVLIVVEKRSI